jgi:hypothetical protein
MMAAWFVVIEYLQRFCDYRKMRIQHPSRFSSGSPRIAIEEVPRQIKAAAMARPADADDGLPPRQKNRKPRCTYGSLVRTPKKMLHRR